MTNDDPPQSTPLPLRRAQEADGVALRGLPLTKNKRPYLTTVSVGRRWWYLHTRCRYAHRSYRFLGLRILVVSYKRIKDF